MSSFPKTQNQQIPYTYFGADTKQLLGVTTFCPAANQLLHRLLLFNEFGVSPVLY